MDQILLMNHPLQVKRRAATAVVPKDPHQVGGAWFVLATNEYKVTSNPEDDIGVPYWWDSTASAHHLVNEVDAGYPNYFDGAGPNSRPRITFDGANDRLYLATLPGAGFTEFTVAFVMKAHTIAEGRGVMSWAGSPGFNDWDIINSGNFYLNAANQFGFYRPTGADTPNVFGAIDTTSWNLWVFRFKAGVLELYKNGTLLMSDTGTVLTMTPTLLNLGARLYGGVAGDWANVSFAHVSAWFTGRSDSNLASLHSYLKTRYAL